MKSVLRLVKNEAAAGKKPLARREQRFRFPAEEVWEVSCGSARIRPAQYREGRLDDRLEGRGEDQKAS